MTTSEMTDAELNYALAEAMGFVHHDEDRRTAPQICSLLVFEHWHRPDGELLHPTDAHTLNFAGSIDALSAVEVRLREAGLFQVVSNVADRDVEVRWFAPTDTWGGEPTVDVQLNTPNEARARAEAALLALRAIEPTSITTLASREGREITP